MGGTLSPFLDKLTVEEFKLLVSSLRSDLVKTTKTVKRLEQLITNYCDPSLSSSPNVLESTGRFSAAPKKRLGVGGVGVKRAYPPEFSKFWSACHPKMRVAKTTAYASYVSAVNRGVTQEKLLASLEVHKRGDKFRRGYIPTAANWLDQDRFDDHVDSLRGATEAVSAPRQPDAADLLDLPESW